MKLNKLYCSVFGVPLCEHRKRKLTWTELFDEDKTVWGGVEDQHRYTADIGVWEKGRVKQMLFSKDMFSTCQNDTSLVQWRQVQESNKSVVNHFLNPLWWNHQSKTCTSQRTLDSCIKVVKRRVQTLIFASWQPILRLPENKRPPGKNYYSTKFLYLAHSQKPV